MHWSQVCQCFDYESLLLKRLGSGVQAEIRDASMSLVPPWVQFLASNLDRFGEDELESEQSELETC